MDTLSLSKISGLMADRFDLAGGLREDSVNDFLSAHFKAESGGQDSVYEGGGILEEAKIEFSYKIASPAKADLAPIDPGRFSKLYAAWVSTVPELSRFTELPDDLGKDVQDRGPFTEEDPPPNIQIKVDQIELTIKATPDDGDPIEVTLRLAIEVTGFVEVRVEDGRHVIRITPIDARISDRDGFLKALDEALSAVDRGLKLSDSDKGVESDCTSLRRLIIHIANYLLAQRVGQFVQEFELPVPIELYKGVRISGADIAIVDDLLVVMARATDVSVAEGFNFTSFFASIGPVLGIQSADEFLHKGGRADEAIAVLSERREAAKLQKTKDDEIELAEFPKRGVFLIFHRSLMQMLASKLLVYREDGGDSGDWWKFKYSYDWFLRIWDPLVSIDGNKLRVGAKFEGGAGAKACVETHCGDKCWRVHAIARPSRLTDGRVPLLAEFEFRNKELWVDPEVDPFRVDWEVGGFGWPINQFVEWLLEGLSRIGVLFARIWAARYEVKITTLPITFPGTTLSFDVRFDRNVIKDPARDALMAVGEVDFKPN